MFRAIYEWNIPTGKQSRIFQHPSKRPTFSSFATDPARTKLYAIDSDNVLFTWNLTTSDDHINSARRPEGCLTRQGGKQSRKASVQLPSQAAQLETTNKEQEIDATVCIDNGVVIRNHMAQISHVDVITSEVTPLTEHECTALWCLGGRYVMFVEQLQEAIKKNIDAWGRAEDKRRRAERRYVIYDCKSKTKEILSNDVMPTMFAVWAGFMVYHEATGEMLILDDEQNALHLWNPLTRETRLVKVEVMTVS